MNSLPTELTPFLQRAQNYCSRYEKCSNDVRTKLVQWGVEKSDCEKVLQELIGQKFVSDERFAELFVKSKINMGWGKRKIFSALAVKRISKDIINKNLTDIEIPVDLERLKELLIRKSKTIKAKNEYDHKAKLFRFAISKGFEIEDVKRALKIDDYSA